MLIQVWEVVKTVFDFLIGHLTVLNLIFAVIIVFFQRRDPKGVWAWLLLLIFLPYLGFIFYLLVGQDLHKRKMFRIKELEDRLNETIRQQENQLKSLTVDPEDDYADYRDLVLYNLETSGAVLSADNDVEFFTDGNKKFDALIADMEKAEKFIHLQYYIFKNDVLMDRIREVLTRKAKEGVEVRLLYDSMGSRTVSKRFWRKLEAEGVHVAEFFPAILGRLQMRANYRNHRKIVVIDNKIAYVGGFNVAKEYIDLSERFGHWRDTHMRIVGSSVASLHLRFLLDWNYASGENLLQDDKYFADMSTGARDHCPVQIISSGPDNTTEQIRDNYLRLISRAKESIYIQTPYYIPDEAIHSALLLAIRSGIEVNVMIPCKPDHPFVYWATYSYVGELIMAGANCYTYDNGFLHSKGMVVDGKVLCYGTANMDIRSYSLNFEVNAVIYDSAKAAEMERIFKEDLIVSTKITAEQYAARSLKIRIKEQISRLLSPVL